MATQTLLPTADYADGGIFSYSSGTTAFNLLTDNEATNKITFANVDGYIEVEIQEMGSAVTINSVQVYCQDQGTGGGADTFTDSLVYLRIGGVQYSSSSTGPTASTRLYAATWTTNPATGEAWTSVSINSIQAIGFACTTWITAGCSPTYLVLNVDYLPAPDSTDITRQLGSVDLWLKRRPETYITMTGNLDLLNASMMQPVDLEHTAGPHSTDAGWEEQVWQRRPGMVHGISIDPNTLTVRLKMKDQRPVRCLVRDLAWSDKASGVLLDGIARFATPGATFTHTRASEHSFTNPVGETEVATTNVPAYGLGGLYMLSASGGRAAPRYYVSNNSGSRTLSAAQGSFQAEVNLAAVTSSVGVNQTVAYCYHDASNWWWLYYMTALGAPPLPQDRWAFQIRAAGVTYTAYLNTTPSAATWYQIGARWTGSNAENGDAAYTLSIFVDRVKGTDAVAGAAMTEVASSNFDFGSAAAAGTDQLNGQIRKIHSYQDVLTDTEMMRPI